MKLQNAGLVAFYNMWLGNEVGMQITPDPNTHGNNKEINLDMIQTCSTEKISNILNCRHVLDGGVDLLTHWHYHVRPVL